MQSFLEQDKHWLERLTKEEQKETVALLERCFSMLALLNSCIKCGEDLTAEEDQKIRELLKLLRDVLANLS